MVLTHAQQAGLHQTAQLDVVFTVPGMLDEVADGPRARREAIRQAADLRRRLEAAESALAAAQAAAEEAETEFDTAQDRYAQAERALDDAMAARDRARRARYAARKERERITAMVGRFQRRLQQITERLDRLALPTGVPL